MYIVNARWMISGEVLKYLNRERWVMAGRYPAPCHVSSLVPLTEPIDWTLPSRRMNST
jgi:hypothetical protein